MRIVSEKKINHILFYIFNFVPFMNQQIIIFFINFNYIMSRDFYKYILESNFYKYINDQFIFAKEDKYFYTI